MVHPEVLIARFCNFYNCTDDHALQMPAKRFFLLDRGRLLVQAEQKAELCDLYAIPNCTIKWANSLKKTYLDQIKRIQGEETTRKIQSVNVIKSDSVEAKRLFMTLFNQKKRGG